MKFANFCMEPKYPTLDVLYDEFERCLSSHHHDDLPDNLGYQPLYAPQATQAIVENKTDMFYVVDRIGWNEIYNPDSTANAYYSDEHGNLLPWNEQTQQDSFWTPEPETPAETPNGMPNILGVGIFG